MNWHLRHLSRSIVTDAYDKNWNTNKILTLVLSAGVRATAQGSWLLIQLQMFALLSDVGTMMVVTSRHGVSRFAAVAEPIATFQTHVNNS